MHLPTPPERILIIRPSALGDVCRTVPVLASLRAAWPEATIDWVVQDSFADAIRGHPALNTVVAFPRTRLAGWWRSPRIARASIRWFGDLRRGGYDLVLDCQGLGRSGLMAFATRAPRRVGHRSAREFAWLGYNQRVGGRRARPRHTVDAMLELIEAIGIDAVRDMSLVVPPDSAESWRMQARAAGLEPGRFAVLAPSSRWVSKQWPIERWCELPGPLERRGFERMVIVAAPGEEPQLRPLIELAISDERVVDLAGQLAIGQTMAAIADAGLLVANDSAPLHMAVGLRTPSVGLFGPTDPAIVGPYEDPMHIVQAEQARQQLEAVHFKDARLGDAMMRLISVDDVLEAIDRRLNQL